MGCWEAIQGDPKAALRMTGWGVGCGGGLLGLGFAGQWGWRRGDGAAAAVGKRVMAQMYTQRAYDREELEALFEVR